MKRLISALLITASILTLIPSAAYGASLRELINSQPLNPIRNQLYGERIDEILLQCGYGQSDTYTVLKNCHAWLVNNVRYRDETPSFFGIYPTQDLINAYAYAPLFEGVGVCNEYSGAFYIMAQAIGLKPYYCEGSIGNEGHAWVELELDGEFYIFDAEVEDKAAGGGSIKYSYFGRSASAMSGTYHLDEDMFFIFRLINNYIPIGEAVGTFASTSIKTYINGIPVNTYNAGGVLCLKISDLEGCGVQTYWDEAARNVDITINVASLYDGGVYKSGLIDGAAAGEIYYTDITVSVGGKAVNSLHIGDTLLISVDALENFGTLIYNDSASEIYYWHNY